MKRSRFTEEQIIGMLKEYEAGTKTAEICRKHGISEATFYNYKAKYGSMEVFDVRQLKASEEENAKLKSGGGAQALRLWAPADHAGPGVAGHESQGVPAPLSGRGASGQT